VKFNEIINLLNKEGYQKKEEGKIAGGETYKEL
jgi:hypothetical protein